MESSQSPQSIILACLVLLVVLVVFCSIMNFLLTRAQVKTEIVTEKRHKFDVKSILLSLLIILLVILFLSDAMISGWTTGINLKPEDIVVSIPWETALSIFLYLWIFFISIIIYLTGGGINSPYITYFGLFPVLAILFDKPATWMVTYIVFMAIIAIIIFYIPSPTEKVQKHSKSYKLAFVFGEVTSIVIATFIGFITN